MRCLAEGCPEAHAITVGNLSPTITGPQILPLLKEIKGFEDSQYCGKSFQVQEKKWHVPFNAGADFSWEATTQHSDSWGPVDGYHFGKPHPYT